MSCTSDNAVLILFKAGDSNDFSKASVRRLIEPCMPVMATPGVTFVVEDAWVLELYLDLFSRKGAMALLEWFEMVPGTEASS